MRIVCLCGSVRHRDEFLAAQAAETLAGRIVLGPGVFSGPDGVTLSTQQVEELHTLHRRKIDLADELLIVTPDGRIGESTAAELAYGSSLGKPIRYWTGVGRPALVDPVEALAESHRA
jgi:hypothetical protein